MSYRTRYAAMKRQQAAARAEAPEAVAWREAMATVREQMLAEKAERFPDGINEDNADAFLEWHDARYAELRAPVDAEYERATGQSQA